MKAPKGPRRAPETKKVIPKKKRRSKLSLKTFGQNPNPIQFPQRRQEDAPKGPKRAPKATRRTPIRSLEIWPNPKRTSVTSMCALLLSAKKQELVWFRSLEIWPNPKRTSVTSLCVLLLSAKNWFGLEVLKSGQIQNTHRWRRLCAFFLVCKETRIGLV